MIKLDGKAVIKSALMLILGFQSFGCSKEITNYATSDHGDNTLVQPSYNDSSVLRNPLNGWVMYAARTADESYWDTEFYVPD